MLVIAGQGSLSQIFIGLIVSTVSLCAQIRLAPYKHWEGESQHACTPARRSRSLSFCVKNRI
jgi:hypothetical protein